MRGPRTAAIAHKKPDAEMLKKRKAEKNTKKDKASKKDPYAPKRPSSAFFIFMEDFRKSFKENYPDQKSGPAVGKAGGEKWKSMSDAEKAPYAEKALKRKADYEKAVRAYKTKVVKDAMNRGRNLFNRLLRSTTRQARRRALREMRAKTVYRGFSSSGQLLG